MAQPKLKVCRAPECDEKFRPWNSTHVACSRKCALELVKEKKKREYQKETTRMRREHKGNDRSHQLKLAQAAFNAYIRERDQQRFGCISCGSTTGKWTAGHFKPDKALRFHPDNCHGQCWWNCNSNKSGNLAEYRPNLVKKIGEERVAYLEQYHPPPKYTLEEIIEIKERYRRKLKEIQSS